MIKCVGPNNFQAISKSWSSFDFYEMTLSLFFLSLLMASKKNSFRKCFISKPPFLFFHCHKKLFCKNKLSSERLSGADFLCLGNFNVDFFLLCDEA